MKDDKWSALSAARKPPDAAAITLTPHSPWVWHVSHDDQRLGTVSGDGVDGFTARDINSRSIGHGYVSAEAAMQAWAGPHAGRSSVTYPPGAFTHVWMPGVPPRLAAVGEDGHRGALTRAERQKAADLIQTLLDMVDDGDLAADGPVGVALTRRLEGTMLALKAMNGTVTPTSSRGQGNVESGIPESPAR